MINTVVILIIANNKISKKVNDISIQNKSDLEEYHSTDSPYGQYQELVSDHSPDIDEDDPLEVVDESMITYARLNNDQGQYTSSSDMNELDTLSDDEETEY